MWIKKPIAVSFAQFQNLSSYTFLPQPFIDLNLAENGSFFLVEKSTDETK